MQVLNPLQGKAGASQELCMSQFKDVIVGAQVQSLGFTLLLLLLNCNFLLIFPSKFYQCLRPQDIYRPNLLSSRLIHRVQVTSLLKAVKIPFLQLLLVYFAHYRILTQVLLLCQFFKLSYSISKDLGFLLEKLALFFLGEHCSVFS